MRLANPLFLILSIASIPFIIALFRSQSNDKKIINFLYFLIVLSLSIAAASPQISLDQITTRRSPVLLLDDRSNSMVIKNQSLNVSMPLKREVIISGNESDIKAAIRSELEPNRTFIVRSDLRGEIDSQRLIERLNNLNSTIHFLKTPHKEESSVYVDGPSLTVPGAENKYWIETSSTKEKKIMPKVFVDGDRAQVKTQGGRYYIKKTFEKGVHRIKAKIETNDIYQRNNRYFKRVKVIEKPDLLVIGEKNSLGDELEEYYDLTYRETVPENLDNYYAILLKKKVSSDKLRPYIVEGNGLVYTGDKEMEISPVKKVDKENQETKNSRVILAIDISEGSGGKCIDWVDEEDQNVCLERSSKGGAVANSKKLGYNIVYNLPKQTILGVVAYNDKIYRVSEPKSLTFNRQKIMNKISRIEVGGPSAHQNAIIGARKMLNKTGNIIMVSDGAITAYGQNTNVRQKTKGNATQLPSNVKLFTVGVGDEINENFLEKVATAGNGKYYERNAFYQSIPMFKGGGGTDDSEPLRIVDRSHFITEDYGKSQAIVSNFDSVVPKPAASQLITSTSGNPVLTVWRYGLGRVATFSADNENLGKIMSQEPRLAARTLSWAVGNPQRKQEKRINVESARGAERAVMTSNYPIKGFTRIGKNRFKASIRPKELGFHKYKGELFTMNYDSEIQNLGYREEMMARIAGKTGGEVVNHSNLDSLNVKRSRSSSNNTKWVSLNSYLLLLALFLFLGQVGYRKLNGMM